MIAICVLYKTERKKKENRIKNKTKLSWNEEWHE